MKRAFEIATKIASIVGIALLLALQALAWILMIVFKIAGASAQAATQMNPKGGSGRH